MRTPNKSVDFVEKYRQLVQKYISLHAYGAALFWADKVLALTDNPKDAYWLGQCMFLQKQYHRAAHLLQSRELDKSYILCTYLAAMCYYEANEYGEALKVINGSEADNNILNTDIDVNFSDDTSKAQSLAAFMLLKGKILEGMDNRGLAANCYKQALHYDVYCFEALDILIKYQMLSANEERELLQSIPISKQCVGEEIELVTALYEARLKKYHTPIPKITRSVPQLAINSKMLIFTPESNTPNIAISATSISSTPLNLRNDKKRVDAKNQQNKMQVDSPENLSLQKIQNSLDLHVARAEMLYYNCNYQKCLNLTEKILRKDPYHDECLPIHVACLVELKQSNKLFLLAHKLVDLYPNLALAWFSVGCYYYTIGKNEYARRYLAKSTCLDRLFGPAWLAYGHSFAVENEHDQAMAAYFKASQLMKGCHLPLLYIGLECGLTNNVRLAEKFFQQAQSIAPNDPFIIHEKGIICFHKQDYEAAEANFREALSSIKKVRKGPIPVTWAPLLNNLGHTCRKLKKYEDALEFHQQALLLNPQSASTFSSIAYVNVLLENYEEAIDWFHKALGLKRDDTFSTTMLNYVIEQWSEDQIPCTDAEGPEGLPKFEAKSRNVTMDSKSGSISMEMESKSFGGINDTPFDSKMSVDSDL